VQLDSIRNIGDQPAHNLAYACQILLSDFVAQSALPEVSDEQRRSASPEALRDERGIVVPPIADGGDHSCGRFDSADLVEHIKMRQIGRRCFSSASLLPDAPMAQPAFAGRANANADPPGAAWATLSR
jgi:hypothetical protein